MIGHNQLDIRIRRDIRSKLRCAGCRFSIGLGVDFEVVHDHASFLKRVDDALSTHTA